MPPTTRSNGKPPPSRIYNTTPTLHQVQFPARRKVVKTYSKKKGTPNSKTELPEDTDDMEPPSSKRTPSASATTKKASKRYNAQNDPRQKTLTQIDFVSSSFSELPNLEFSESEAEKENDEPEENEEEDEEPVLSAKRKMTKQKANKSKRRRTLGDQVDSGRPKKDRNSNRRKTLGDAPSASAYHTQTLTQFVGRDAMMIRDSEDEDEGGFEDWLQEADSPTIRAKNHAAEQHDPSRAKSSTQQAGEPSTPAKNRSETNLWEVPSSSHSGTPLSSRMLARYGAPDSNKPTPSKGTQGKEVITEAKGKIPSLVIQDSFATASWDSLSKVSPSKKTPSKGTPLKDITEEVVAENEETPSRKASERASQRASQRARKHVKFGKENETPTKVASQRSQRGTPTPTKRKSPKKLSSGKFEIPDSDEDDGGFTDSESEDVLAFAQEKPQKASAPESAPTEEEQMTHLDNAQQDDPDSTDDSAQLPATTASGEEEQFTHLDKTQQEGTSVVDYGFNSSVSPSTKREEASYVDRTQQQDSVKGMLPPSSTEKSEQFTHIDKTQQDASVVDFGFIASSPRSAKPDGEASFVDKTPQQGSIHTMLPPSSTGKSQRFSRIDETPQKPDVAVSYDFEAFPTTSQASTQEDEEPYTHIDKTQHDEGVTPRAHVRFQSTPAIIPSPVPPVPTVSEDRVAATQDSKTSGIEVPFATAKEVAAKSPEPEISKPGEDNDGGDDYAGTETQNVWKEIESSREDPFSSTTSSRQRTASAATPNTSPQLPPPKPASLQKQKPLRKPLRTLPPSSQTQPLESQRIPLSVIQAMGAPTPRSDIILPVPSSSLAPLISGHTLHLELPYKIPSQVVRFWLFENREVVRYGVFGELEEESIDANGQKTWRYFIPQVFELNNPRTEEDLTEEGYIWKKVERYTYLDPGPVAQLLANLRQALFSVDGEDEPETQLTEVEEEPSQHEPPSEPPELPRTTTTPKKQTPNPGSSFSISQAVEAQLLSEQATHTQPTDEILCPSTPLKERPSAPPSTNPIDSGPPPQTFVRPSQATTASQVSTPEKQSQYLPAASPTSQRQVQSTTARRTMLPPESSSSHMTFPETDCSPPFLIPLSQAGGLRSSQLLTKSQMLPDSLVKDDGEWDASG